MEHHSLSHLLMFLIIGGVIGWLAGLIVRGRGFGVLADIVIGILGAMLGGWLADVLGISISSNFGDFMMAIVGAVILVGITRLVVRTV